MFAPTLVFHPDERYYPTSPLVDLSSFVANAEPRDAESWQSLGSLSARLATYDALPVESKLQLASVFYRVRDASADESRTPGALTIEYWIYYPRNEYHTHGGLVPIGAGGNHVHDLEHVFIVIRPNRSPASRLPTPDSRPSTPDSPLRTPDRHPSYHWDTLIASAHIGSVPNNRYHANANDPTSGQPVLLVELGAHAMAPDIDDDGWFTPSVDVSGPRKFVWGVRDRGDIWARYRKSYADRRDPATAVRLTGPTIGSDVDDARCHGTTRCSAYRLRRAEDLDAHAADALSASRDDLLIGTPWLKRLFGEVDASQLLAPRLHAEWRDPTRMLNRVVRSERGVAVGFSSMKSMLTPMISARWLLANDITVLPDILLEGGGMLTLDGRALTEATVAATYPIDAITKLVVGGSLLADKLNFEDRKPNVIGGVEFRLNRWRVRAVARDPQDTLWLDFRLMYLF